MESNGMEQTKAGTSDTVKEMNNENMEKAPTHLDLFSGIGGFAIACRWAGFRTIGFCEIDRYCQKVLAKNFVADALRDAEQEQGYGRSAELSHREARMVFIGQSPPRIHSDIFDFDGTQFRGVDLVTGGFPCQPFSVAGKRRGAADDRAIWPQMFRVIKESRPAWVLGENVPGLIPVELDNVLSDLEGIGYAVRAFVIPACAVDARHRRDRVWIVGRNMGNSEREGSQGHWGEYGLREVGSEIEAGRSSNDFSYARSRGQQGQGQLINAVNPKASSNGQATEPVDGSQHCVWESQSRLGGVADELSDWLDGPYCVFPSEPNIPRVAQGVKNRVDRLKGLGNSILPRVAYEILREIRRLIQP
jgi:DNA (cytosine-5)-methyltransferase 1